MTNHPNRSRRIANKRDYLATLQSLYRVANLSDSDSPNKAGWLDAHASNHQCARIDEMLRSLADAGSITEQEKQSFYDTM